MGPSLIDRPRFWTGRRLRDLLYQVLILGCVVAVVYFVARTTVANLEARGTALGFDFLGEQGGFAIGFSLIDRNGSHRPSRRNRDDPR
jgi:general L-amino acid transport system permease protein